MAAGLKPLFPSMFIFITKCFVGKHTSLKVPLLDKQITQSIIPENAVHSNQLELGMQIY